MSERIGRVQYIDARMGLLAILEEGKDGELRPCTFDKIEDYDGQDPADLFRFSPRGLQERTLVKFEVTDEDKIRVVKPLVFGH